MTPDCMALVGGTIELLGFGDVSDAIETTGQGSTVTSNTGQWQLSGRLDDDLTLALTFNQV